MIDVTVLHGAVPTAAVTVRTYAASTIDAYGRAVDGAITDAAETMPVHPVTSKRTLERLPEADRFRETIALYPLAGTALARASGSRPPRVQYGGRWYEVVADGDYETQGGIRIVLAQLVDATA